MAICGYRLGYQRQLSADALLTFADGTPKRNPDAITAGSVASDATSSKPTTAQLGEGAGFRSIVQLNCHY